MKTLEKITLNKAELLAAIDPCAKATSGNSPIAILKCLKFDFLGGELEITGSDSKTWVTRRVLCRGDHESFCVNSNLLRGAINSMRSGEIEITPSATTVVFTGNGSRFSFPIIDAVDYPLPPNIKDGKTIQGSGKMVAALNSVITAAMLPKDEKLQLALTAVNMTPTIIGMRAASTNTHMLLVDEMDGQCEEEVLISREFLSHVGDLEFSNAEEVVFEWNEVVMSCERSGDRVISSRLYSSTSFPPIERAIPTELLDPWIVDVDEFESALRSVKSIAESSIDPVLIRRTQEGMTVRLATDARGESLSSLSCAGGEIGKLFKVNGKYLSTILSACPTPKIHIGIPTGVVSKRVKFNASEGMWIGVIFTMALNTRDTE